MYEVTINRECSCFKKSALKNNQDFNSMAEAKAEAERMMKVIDETFCAKHTFRLKQEPLGFQILCADRGR